MHIELTRTTGSPLLINILAIDSVEGPGGSGFFSNSNTSISIGDSTYYVIESYSDVKNLIEEAKKEIPKEILIKKYVD
ncbi:hypothetical protein [Lysinibacillus fusiformis]|uniref:hypothetical protein n=1 Tax=Lysinibacillus fusiformis TaxID=28031 RepID=UPI00187E1CE2|nr:hypothetical protein [Lysinibacillus fusiformis]MBD8523719.1 hypothetical protein [Lysinibacillus fusiformis]